MKNDGTLITTLSGYIAHKIAELEAFRIPVTMEQKNHIWSLQSEKQVDKYIQKILKESIEN